MTKFVSQLPYIAYNVVTHPITEHFACFVCHLSNISEARIGIGHERWNLKLPQGQHAIQGSWMRFKSQVSANTGRKEGWKEYGHL